MIPKRPAVFYPDSEGWEWGDAQYDKDGKKHGISLGWTLSGHLHGEELWEHGVVIENKNFHPDGKISSHMKKTGENEQHCAFFKATCESPEPWGKHPENIQSLIRYSDDAGFSRHRVTYFDGQGNEVQHTGMPIRPRPASVHRDAVFFKDQRWWVQNRVTLSDELPVGQWTRWLN